jgi:hypothetical protein
MLVKLQKLHEFVTNSSRCRRKKKFGVKKLKYKIVSDSVKALEISVVNAGSGYSCSLFYLTLTDQTVILTTTSTGMG